MDFSELARFFETVLCKFFRVHSLKRLIAAEKHYNNLPVHHRDLIPDFLANLRSIRKCTEQNFEIIKLIIAETDVMFENIHHESPAVNN